MSFTFHERDPKPWHGRYRRIPGKPSVLHVRWDDTIDLIWQDGHDTSTCIAHMTPSLHLLGQALNRVKTQRTGQSGGSFVINEFGQVICPVADDSFERLHVGDCQGAITFVGTNGHDFTLSDDSGLRPGDGWKLPYIGIPFNLSHVNRIYFQMRDDCETECIFAPTQDQNLIGALRRVRNHGGIRFIVNPHGIVLTKVKEESAVWRPKYVGRINRVRWFAKENA